MSSLKNNETTFAFKKMLINELGATLDFKKSLRNSKLRVIKKKLEKRPMVSDTPFFKNMSKCAMLP